MERIDHPVPEHRYKSRSGCVPHHPRTKRSPARQNPRLEFPQAGSSSPVRQQGFRQTLHGHDRRMHGRPTGLAGSEVVAELHKLIAHTLWANEEWITFIDASFPADEYLLTRMSHILLGEQAWFQRILGKEPDRKIWQ